jgi:hypothetical protein
MATRQGSTGGVTERSLSKTSQIGPHRDQNKPQHQWLDAWSDPIADVRAFSSCICTCNLLGDGDWRLVIADRDNTIKVGPNLQQQVGTPSVHLPPVHTSAVVAFLAFHTTAMTVTAARDLMQHGTHSSRTAA